MTEKIDPRIPEIVRGKSQGKTYTDIAKALDISRKTVYNLRSSDSYLEIVDKIFTSLMDEIEELSESDSHTVRVEGMKEKGRVLRALLPSLSVIQHRADPAKHERETANETTAKRKRSEALINSLKLTPKQMKVLEENVVSEYDEE